MAPATSGNERNLIPKPGFTMATQSLEERNHDFLTHNKKPKNHPSSLKFKSIGSNQVAGSPPGKIRPYSGFFQVAALGSLLRSIDIHKSIETSKAGAKGRKCVEYNP